VPEAFFAKNYTSRERAASAFIATALWLGSMLVLVALMMV
jgi:hypothetical protein